MTFTEERYGVTLENKGQKIFGVFHRPKEMEKAPAILVCHGFGGTKVGVNRLLVRLAVELVKLGISVLRVDFRGSGDSEGEFHEMTLESEVADCQCAFDYLTQHPHVDADRIGLHGASFGGAVAVYAAHAFKNIKAISLWAPVSNGLQWIKEWEKATQGGHEPHVLHTQGQHVGLPFFKSFFSMQPATILGSELGHIPVLHVHGLLDDVVLVFHAENFEKERRSASAESRFLTLDRSDHSFSDEQEQAILLAETSQWFQKQLEN